MDQSPGRTYIDTVNLALFMNTFVWRYINTNYLLVVLEMFGCMIAALQSQQ